MRHANEDSVNLIKGFEKFVGHVYADAVGLSTIGYGHLIVKGESFDTMTEQEAEELLKKDLGRAERSVLRLINVPLTDNQFGALVSFTFNLGGGTLQHSTLRMRINRSDFDIESEFLKYKMAGGRILKGLLRRRQAEYNLFQRQGLIVEPETS